MKLPPGFPGRFSWLVPDFPTRPDQHVAADTSLLVFQECLPARWIFRNQGTSNDYGIDAEVELVGPGGQLRGHIAKVQLKGQARLERNGDGSITVGGIKQSTLRYWLGLSRYANVILALTDNGSRETYFTPAFWQATQLLDGTEATKTIRFKPEWQLKAADGPHLFAQETIDRPWNVVRAHEELLRALPETLYDFLWVHQADAWSLHNPCDATLRWLRNGKALLEPGLSEEDKTFFDFEYWRQKSERDWGDAPMRGTMREIYQKTFPMVFTRLHAISRLVQNGSHYWTKEAPEYFELTDATPVPEQLDWWGIQNFVLKHQLPEPL